jgi:hypothetical protein
MGMTSSIGKINLGDLQSGSVWGSEPAAYKRSSKVPQFSDLSFELLLSSQGLIRRTQSGGGTGGSPSLVDSQLLFVALQLSSKFLCSFIEMFPAGFSTDECLARLAQLFDLTYG